MKEEKDKIDFDKDRPNKLTCPICGARVDKRWVKADEIFERHIKRHEKEK